MVKFDKKLNGYGFDINADRLVRFNKHPDGTYLNTRATYSINKLQFTHYYLRSLALKLMMSQMSESEIKEIPKKKFPMRWLIGGFIVGFLVLTLMDGCTMNVSGNMSLEETQVIE